MLMVHWVSSSESELNYALCGSGFRRTDSFAALGSQVVSQDSRSARHTVNIYDMRNKLVAFHVLLPQGQAVKRIACQVCA